MPLLELEKRVRDPSLKLWLPLSFIDGVAFVSQDAYAMPLTPVGAYWTPEGWYFDGVNDKMSATPAASAHLDFTSEDFSAIVRLKYKDLGKVYTFPYRGALNLDGWLFAVSALDALTLYTFQAAALQGSSTPDAVLVTGETYTLGFSRQGASVRLYVNGVDLTSTVGNHVDPVTCNRSFAIGDYSIATAPGSLSELLKVMAIWQRWLSPLEHAELHHMFKEVFG